MGRKNARRSRSASELARRPLQSSLNVDWQCPADQSDRRRIPPPPRGVREAGGEFMKAQNLDTGDFHAAPSDFDTEDAAQRSRRRSPSRLVLADEPLNIEPEKQKMRPSSGQSTETLTAANAHRTLVRVLEKRGRQIALAKLAMLHAGSASPRADSNASKAASRRVLSPFHASAGLKT